MKSALLYIDLFKLVSSFLVFYSHNISAVVFSSLFQVSVAYSNLGLYKRKLYTIHGIRLFTVNYQILREITRIISCLWCHCCLFYWTRVYEFLCLTQSKLNWWILQHINSLLGYSPLKLVILIIIIILLYSTTINN